MPINPDPAGKIPSIVFPSQITLERIVCDAKPIVFTESGYHNAINVRNDQPGISEAAAARYIPRLFLEDFLHGIPRTYLYEIISGTSRSARRGFRLGRVRFFFFATPRVAACSQRLEALWDSAQHLLRS